MGDSQTRRFDAALLELAQRWTGRVEAVHRHATVAGAADGATRLTLLAAGLPMVPWGITLPAGREPPALANAVCLEGRRLRWGGLALALVGPGVALTIDPTTPPASRAALGRQLEILQLPERTRALLGEGGPSRSVEGKLVDRLATALRTVCGALLELPDDDLGFASTVTSLVGLGPGLTPTGDDLLVGVAAAAHRLAVAGGLPCETLRDLAAAFDQLPPGRTTPVARQMLVHAGHGLFPEPLPPLVAALGDDRVASGDLALLVDDLLRLGSWSGADMLAGVLGLMRAWVDGVAAAAGATHRHRLARA